MKRIMERVQRDPEKGVIGLRRLRRPRRRNPGLLGTALIAGGAYWLGKRAERRGSFGAAVPRFNPDDVGGDDDAADFCDVCGTERGESRLGQCTACDCFVCPTCYGDAVKGLCAGCCEDEVDYGGQGIDRYEDFDDDFADPGGESALRAGPRDYPCPTCRWPNRLSARDVQLGYQCDRCARATEGHGDINYFEGETGGDDYFDDDSNDDDGDE